MENHALDNSPPRKGGKNTARRFILMKPNIIVDTILYYKSTVSNLFIFSSLGEN